jgi:hypothetical protein
MRTVIARIFDYSLDGVIAEDPAPRHIPSPPNRKSAPIISAAGAGPSGCPHHVPAVTGQSQVSGGPHQLFRPRIPTRRGRPRVSARHPGTAHPVCGPSASSRVHPRAIMSAATRSSPPRHLRAPGQQGICQYPTIR